LSPRRKPPWSSWSVGFAEHALEQAINRGLTELDVRHILEHTRRYWRSRHRGRWLVSSSLHGVPWIIVVQPSAEQLRFTVVTVFERRE